MSDPFKALAERCAELAIGAGIKNYSGASYTVEQDTGERFELVITVQRVGHVSPQEANEKLKAQLAELWRATQLLLQVTPRNKSSWADKDAARAIIERLSASAEPSAQCVGDQTAQELKPQLRDLITAGFRMVGSTGQVRKRNTEALETMLHDLQTQYGE